MAVPLIKNQEHTDRSLKIASENHTSAIVVSSKAVVPFYLTKCKFCSTAYSFGS